MYEFDEYYYPVNYGHNAAVLTYHLRFLHAIPHSRSNIRSTNAMAMLLPAA